VPTGMVAIAADDKSQMAKSPSLNKANT
jgi:hypothetical protein